METMQNNWAAAVREVCSTNRGTVPCEVKAGVAEGEKCYIELRDGRLRLVRVADGFSKKLPADFDLRRLRVEAEIGARLTRLAAEILREEEIAAAAIAREQEIASAVALLRFNQKMARKAGRWKSSGQFQTQGAVQPGG